MLKLGASLVAAAAAVAVVVMVDPAGGAQAPVCTEAALLDSDVPNNAFATTPVAGVDGSGNILVAWGYGFPAQLYAARFNAGTGWGPKTPVDTGPAMDGVTRVAMAVNGAGSALLVWTGPGGLYVSTYAPGTGWGSAQTIASGPSLFFDFANSFAAALDEAGRGLLAWSEHSHSILSSTYDPNTLEWSTPVVVADRVTQGGHPVTSLVTSVLVDMDASGNAVLAWSWYDITPGSGALYAARFVPGQGWQAPDPLWSSVTGIPLFSIAADEVGGAMAVWVEESAAFPEHSLYASRYVPGQGWQAADLVSDAGRPSDPAIDVAPNGNALVAWRTGFDKTVSARRYDAGAGWQTTEVLRQYPIGDPGPIRTRLFGQANALVAWGVGGSGIEAVQYLPSSGWRPIDVLGARVKGTSLAELAAVNGSTAIVTWIDTYGVASDYFSDVYATRFDLPVDPDLCDISVTTSSTTSTSSTTTTTLPRCTTPRCQLDAALESAACAHDTIPSGISRKLRHATEVIEAAPAVTPRKAKRLYRRAQGLLRGATEGAQRASRGKRPRLSPACATTIRNVTQQVARGLGAG